jgi:hypothetical protein
MDEPSTGIPVGVLPQGNDHSQNVVVSVGPDLARRNKKQQNILGGVSSIVTDGSHCANAPALDAYRRQNELRTLHELRPLRMAMPGVTTYRHSPTFYRMHAA